MKNIIKNLGVLLFFLVMLIPFYGKLLLQPNSYFFGQGDGMKNYYTPAYHIEHDSSYLYLEGMNYPHGEHVVYTDGQFLVSNTLKFINHNIVAIGDYSVGILNWLMLLSFALGGFLVFKILSQLNVHRALALLGSVTIMLLSPQALRLSAHYALVYACHIPLIWWIMLRPSLLKKPIRWGSLLILTTFGWFLIHPYLGMMLTLFQLSYWAVSFLRDRQQWKTYLLWILFAVLPVVLFKFFMQSTDIHSGRIDTPWGFLFFCGELDDIFVPNSGPLHAFLTKALAVPIFQRWEAMAYVGVFTTLALTALIVIKIVSLFNKKLSIDSYLPNKQLQNSLLASIPILLFAMGFPFKQFPILLEQFPAVNQLRSVGRFGWIFFYVATICSIYFYHQVWQKHKSVGLKIGIAVVLTFSLIEPMPFHLNMSKEISHYPNLLNKKLLPPVYNKMLAYSKQKDYQALLPIPYYNIGSETFGYPSLAEVSTSMVFAYHAKLPLLSNHGSRMAAQQSRMGIQLLSPYHAPNPLLDKLDPDRPILVLKEQKKYINKYEYLFLLKSTKIADLGQFALYEIYPKQIGQNHNQAEIDWFDNARNSNKLYQQGKFYSNKPVNFIYFDGFDQPADSVFFDGTKIRALQSIASPDTTLATFPPYTFEEDKVYNLKLWVYNKDYLTNNFWPWFMARTVDPKTNKAHELFQISARSMPCIYGDWTLLEHSFKVDSVQQQTIFSVQLLPQTPLPLRLDNLLIYENAGQNIYWTPATYEETNRTKILFKNNLKVANAPE